MKKRNPTDSTMRNVRALNKAFERFKKEDIKSYNSLMLKYFALVAEHRKTKARLRKLEAVVSKLSKNN